jgi:hypothetical protein
MASKRSLLLEQQKTTPYKRCFYVVAPGGSYWNGCIAELWVMACLGKNV